MAKKIIEYDPDDPLTWSEDHMNKYILDKVTEIAKTMPWDKVVLSTIFIYAHWKAYGQGPLPTMGDVMLGIVYAMTIPEALQGGLAANAYAIGALSALAIGVIVPADKIEEAKKEVENAFEEVKKDGNVPYSYGKWFNNMSNRIKGYIPALSNDVSIPTLKKPSL